MTRPKAEDQRGDRTKIRAERKVAKIDAWVKEQLPKERAAGELKRERFKVLRITPKNPS